MTLKEKQQNIILDCRKIFDYYMGLPEMDWERLINKAEPYIMDKYGEDPDVKDFASYRFVDMCRELQVLRGISVWPIKK